MNTTVDLSTIARIGIDPAASEASARDTPAFVAMAAEIAKLESIHAAEVSWSTVRDTAIQVLGSAHDLLAVAYLTYALQRTHGFPGLSAGLAVVERLLDHRWSSAQPPPDRMKARRAALQWLAERSARQVPATPPDPQAEAACERAARGLAESCRERFEGADGGFAALARVLTPRTDAPVATDADAAPDEERADAGETGSVVKSSASTPSRAHAVQRLADAALYFQRCEPHSPIGPLLQRALAWSGKSFSEVFSELLTGSPEARNGMWKTLGIPPESERT